MSSKKGAKSRTSGQPRLRVMILALVAALLAGLCIYWLNSRPQAGPIEAGTPWSVKSREAAVLYGIAPGSPVLSIEFRAPTALRADFGKGAMIGGTSAPRAVRALVTSVAGESIAISVRTKPGPGTKGSVMIVPQASDPALSGFAIRAVDTPLEVEAVLVPGESGEQQGHISIDPPFDQLDSLSATVPPGSFVGFDYPPQPGGKLLIEAGDIDDEYQSPRLAIAAVETGMRSGSTVERSSFACGAANGTIKWLSLGSAIDAADCAPGRLWLNGLEIGNGARLSLEGRGYSEKDNVVRTWPGFADLMKNDVFKAIIGAIVLGLVGWMTSLIRKRFSGV